MYVYYTRRTLNEYQAGKYISDEYEHSKFPDFSLYIIIYVVFVATAKDEHFLCLRCKHIYIT